MPKNPSVVIHGLQYRLRAGAPMPLDVAGEGNFVVHTFMAEETTVDIYTYTEELPASTDFRGQGGDYLNAQFSRLSAQGGNSFSGKVVYPPVFVEEK